MAERTAIAWTDSTVNFWWGCTKVGPGCDHCYAEKWAERTGRHIWGSGAPRLKIKSAIGLMRKLNDHGDRVGVLLGGPTHRRRVFIQSMSDLFDLEVPIDWFDEAWSTIHACNRLAIQVVTKRVSVIEKRLAGFGGSWKDGLLDRNPDRVRHYGWPAHAGLIITVVNQEEADRDVPRALALKAKLGIPWLGLSVEPQIGPIDLLKLIPDKIGVSDEEGSRVNWVISGGESKQGKDHMPRPYDLAWARSLRDQCAAAGVAYFQKQLGAAPITSRCTEVLPLTKAIAMGDDKLPRWPVQLLDRRAGADYHQWPQDLRVQQFPEALR